MLTHLLAAAALPALRQKQPHHVFERKLASDVWILVNEHRMPDGGKVVLYTDVTDLKLHEMRIEHIAHHDALTELPNRLRFREKLEEALARARRSLKPVAVFCLDQFPTGPGNRAQDPVQLF